MGYLDLEETVTIEKKNARVAKERRLFMILCNGALKRISDIVSSIMDQEENLLLVTDKKDEFHSLNLENAICISHRETKRILGNTFDNALIDLRDYPDVISLSRSIETVRGGGIILILLPISYMKSEKYLRMLRPIGVKGKPRDFLKRRLIHKSINKPGIHVFSTLSETFISSVIKKSNSVQSQEICIPSTTVFDKRLYKICRTQDQINTLRLFEELSGIDYLLITANRGRGKSAIIGIGITGYAVEYYKKHGKKLYTIVTAPEKENVSEIFNFLRNAHNEIGIANIFNDTMFESKYIHARYIDPANVLGEKADLLIIDEAAGIQFPLLTKLTQRFQKIIFSTTIHGYEGAGRTFSVRFIPLLERSNKVFKWIKLEEPIRYSKTDPVEKWLYEVLLLDAEAGDVNVDEVIKNRDKTELVILDPKKLVANDSELKEYFGILITAHYRNNPKDLLMLLDASHHRPIALCLNSKIIVAMQIAEEGGIDEGEIHVFYETAPSGNIIPDKIFKYYGEIDFLKSVGWRIVRIATHYEIMGQGFGSLALRKLEKIATTTDVDWIGAGFSGYPELLSFWIKNDYLPIHISPKINKTTGEHTIIVIKPLKEKIRLKIKKMQQDLKERLLNELPTTYRNIDSKTVLLILKNLPVLERYNLELNSFEEFRFNLYLKNVLHFESASDVITKVVKYYFAKNLQILNAPNETLLIESVLQRKRVGIKNLIKVRNLVNTIWKEVIVST